MREVRGIEIGDTERIEETAQIEEIAEEVIEIHETVEMTDIAAAAQAENGMYTYTQLYLTGRKLLCNLGRLVLFEKQPIENETVQ